MRSLTAWTWIGVVAALGIVVITTVAAVDHVRKTHAYKRAGEAEWYCAHRRVRCGGASSVRIEQRWMRRERAYKAADVALIAVGGIAVLVVAPRRR